MKGLSNQFCPSVCLSVSQFVSAVKKLKLAHLFDRLGTRVDTVFALIYGTAKNNCIGDCSALVTSHFPLHSNKLEQFCTCQKQLNSY